jgi:hypothetical protein
MSETADAFGVQLTPIAELVTENVARSSSGSAV